MFCFGNWKLNKTPKETKEFLEIFKKNISKEDLKNFCIFPQALSAFCFEGVPVPWGGQNIYSEQEGAFTGENSAKALKEMGAQYCLIGHSERRTLFKETEKELKKKLDLALECGLKPVYCVGESLEQREDKKTFTVIKEQLSIVENKDLILAYEPVWAIGTGKAATAQEAEEVHDWIKKQVGGDVPILYGGSVKPENAKELFLKKSIDGFLIGGASLQVGSFVTIYSEMKAV